MAKAGNAQTRAVHLAKNEIDAVIKSFQSDGHFMDKSVSPQTQARHDRIDNAGPEVTSLLDAGLTQGLADRLARLTKGDN